MMRDPMTGWEAAECEAGETRPMCFAGTTRADCEAMCLSSTDCLAYEHDEERDGGRCEIQIDEITEVNPGGLTTHCCIKKTAAPTPAPTAAPTPAPTQAPTPAPTAAPTPPPTQAFQYTKISGMGDCCRNNGASIGDGGVRSGTAREPADCEAGCNADPNCTHFSHSLEYRNCVLCSECELLHTGNSIHYTSWQKPQATYNFMGQGACRTSSGGMGTFTGRVGTTDALCRADCSNNQACVAYESRQSNGQCEIHTEMITKIAGNSDYSCYVKEAYRDFDNFDTMQITEGMEFLAENAGTGRVDGVYRVRGDSLYQSDQLTSPSQGSGPAGPYIWYQSGGGWPDNRQGWFLQDGEAMQTWCVLYYAASPRDKFPSEGWVVDTGALRCGNPRGRPSEQAARPGPTFRVKA